MRIAYYLFMFSILINNSYAQKSVRQHIDFDKDWKFHLGHACNPEKDFGYGLQVSLAKTLQTKASFSTIDFDDTDWQKVQLPHDWVVALHFQYSENNDQLLHGYKKIGIEYPENSIGWYRKKFTITALDSGKRFELQFDGIFRDSKVWVNGMYVGGNFSGYNGFNFDISNFVVYGKPNVVTVRVDATQFEGWFYEGAGIYRHVWLNEYENLHTSPKDVFVYTATTGDNTKVSADVTINNQNFTSASGSIRQYILDNKGKKVAETAVFPFIISMGDKITVKRQMQLSNAHLWDLEDPYRYTLVTIINEGRNVTDELHTRFGIRTITIDKDKGLFLNGKAIKIKGTCNHEDHAGVGVALPDRLQYYRISLLKAMGANAYRSSHNPPTPELLDACDSLGMLVLDETRLLNAGEEYMGQLNDLILRDRNHPSVFMWSIGNEEEQIQSTSTGKRMARELVARQILLDPTRTCTYAANEGNVYTGVNEVIPVRGFNYNLYRIGDYDKASPYNIDDYHKAHPDQPIIGTEVASTVSTRGIYQKDTINNYLPDQDNSYPRWGSTAEQWWTLADARPWFIGGFVWTGFDYRGEPTPFKWPNINSHFGIMDVCGFPKSIYYYYQSWWTNKNVLHISPHWNWAGKEGKPIDVWVYSNADNIELFLNGKSLGKKDMPKNGHLQWKVNYEAGTLKAVGFKNKKRIQSSIETTGAAYKISLVPDHNTMQANGADIAIFTVSVQDRNGREIPDARDLINFTTMGDARIIGVGNGDPSSHEPDQYNGDHYKRRLFNGKCQVIIQSGNSPGQVTLQANAAGLKSSKISLQQL